MGSFKKWLEDSDIGNAYVPDIDVQKKPLRLPNPLRMPPASRKGERMEKKFGVKRHPAPKTVTLVAREATVPTANLVNAIQKTLEFVVPGEWHLEGGTHPWASDKGYLEGYKVYGHVKGVKVPPPQFFFLSVNAILEKPLQTYDSISGNTAMRIIGSIFWFAKQGVYRKLGERSEKILGHWGPHDGKSLRTPYELAQWVKEVIDSYHEDDDGDDDEPVPEPSDPRLVSV